MVLCPGREDCDVSGGNAVLDPLHAVKPRSAGERPIGRAARTAGERPFQITMAAIC
jgi:hypothetical protein